MAIVAKNTNEDLTIPYSIKNKYYLHMKRKIFLVLLILFIVTVSNNVFSQTEKDKFNAVNDYLETVEEFSTEKKMIIRDKVSPNRTIYILKTDYILAIDSLGNTKSIKDFYSKKDWETMKRTYENKVLPEKGKTFVNKYWKENDFRKTKNLVFVDIPNGSWENAFLQYMDMDSSLHKIYAFSDPIYYSSKKYLIFTFFKSDMFNSHSANEYIVIMKKKQNKWVVAYTGYDGSM
ncbi:hypothetical protein MCETHM1_03166 [Flavobacteriaceae bacterium]|jgi:hypothetical protein